MKKETVIGNKNIVPEFKHLFRQVDADELCLGAVFGHLYGKIACSGCHVKDFRWLLAGDQSGSLTSPDLVDMKGEQMVQEVVSGRDAVKHLGNDLLITHDR